MQQKKYTTTKKQPTKNATKHLSWATLFKPHDSRSGFTLMETLVAIFILTIAIASPLTIAQKSLNSANYAKDQVAAFYLAQEGIEFIRNTRDNNVFNGGTWNQAGGLSDCLAATGCTVDVRTSSIAACPVGGCAVLNQYTSTGSLAGMYSYTSGANWMPTVYTRTINIENINSNEIKVSSKVFWKAGFTDKQFTITEHLLNWQ